MHFSLRTLVATARRLSTAAALVALLSAAGCHRGPNTATPEGQRQAAQQRQQQNEQIRQDLELIPPPVKAKFMTVRNLDSWENPYLTVQEDLVVLHVTLADANTSSFGQGGMLRPTGARRQTLTVRLDELPAALNAVPTTAWPYGRVVAVEEAHDTPARQEPAVRRGMEQVLRTLGELGIVTVEWGENGPSLR